MQIPAYHPLSNFGFFAKHPFPTQHRAHLSTRGCFASVEPTFLRESPPPLSHRTATPSATDRLQGICAADSRGFPSPHPCTPPLAAFTAATSRDTAAKVPECMAPRHPSPHSYVPRRWQPSRPPPLGPPQPRRRSAWRPGIRSHTREARAGIEKNEMSALRSSVWVMSGRAA